MLAEWYLPPGECQVILPIKEGTISISHHAIQSVQTRITQTPFLQADNSYAPQPPGPRIRRSEAPKVGIAENRVRVMRDQAPGTLVRTLAVKRFRLQFRFQLRPVGS